MKATVFFDKFSKEYESQDRNKYLFYRWIVQNIIKQVNRGDSDIVDIGTGTGNLAFRLAKRYPKSRILGVDISKGMIGEAKAKCGRMGITNVRFKISSIENLRIGNIDFVVSALAFHHVCNKNLVISSIYPKLSERGRLVIGDWFEPSPQYVKGVEKLRRRNPELAKRFDKSWEEALKGMSREYGEKHPKEYPISQTDLAGIMKNARFTKQRVLKSLLPNFAVVMGEKR